MILLGRILVGLASTLVTLRYSLGLYAWQLSNKLEKPKYATLLQLPGGVEIRQYEPYTIAEATFPRGTAMKKATGNGFRACAGYIFGRKNRVGGLFARKSSRTMAMTAPVRMVTTAEEQAVTKVSFVMASNETVRSLPTPTDANVKIRSVPGHTAAFVRFSGPPPSEELIAKSRARVEAALASSAYEPVHSSETLTYGYHDPFATPNLLRRNEVGVYVLAKH